MDHFFFLLGYEIWIIRSNNIITLKYPKKIDVQEIYSRNDSKDFFPAFANKSVQNFLCGEHEGAARERDPAGGCITTRPIQTKYKN